jgi:hypothetical protein
MIEVEMADLRDGRRECDAAPPPSPPVVFDAGNADHMVWLLTNLNGREVTGGRLRVRVEYAGKRSEEPVKEQPVY